MLRRAPSFTSSLAGIGATVVIVCSAAFIAFALASRSKHAAPPHAVSTTSSVRLLAQLPDDLFLSNRVGLKVSQLNASGLSFPVVGASAASATALRFEVNGSSVNGTILAQVVNLGSNNSCICWIVSIHPGSPLYGNNAADPRPANFDFHVIDARTGFAYSHYSGIDPSLPPYS